VAVAAFAADVRRGAFPAAPETYQPEGFGQPEPAPAPDGPEVAQRLPA